MGKNSKIAWCDHTQNFWMGCHKVSAGCVNCFMYRDKKRFGQDPTVVVRSSKATFNKPLTWKDPARVFVCSWSDFFISEADPWRKEAYDIMMKTQHLTYLLLTKRPENIAERLLPYFIKRPKNIWLGVTVENQEMANKRIPLLLQVSAEKRFLSIEPMLGPVDLTRISWKISEASIVNGTCLGTNGHIFSPCGASGKGIDWVIVGAESGPKARLMNIEWARDIVKQCKEADVACFVKQLHINGKLSIDLEEWPEDLRIQEFPK